ncbi:MAG TPA: hypothetical protein VMH79_08365 [Thermoanaerobaculia bacterium]|nr:hypothetical protein [Thermoanaerobaculia bacterium]
MPTRDEGSRQRRFGAFLILVLLMRSDDAGGSDGSESSETIVVARAEALPASLVAAVKNAAARLGSPGCREIFSDFHDGQGNTLQQNLDALGVTGAFYLQWTLFYDGTGSRLCERRNILAATAPGSRSVFVCMAQFLEVARREPRLASALVIHEELHSLGLGENPPDSKTITARVLARCGQ